MPRNLHKTRCQVPGCRNWAMRGHTRCRPHRAPSSGPELGPELGPEPRTRGASASAPAGNLNALRTGQRAHPLSPDEVDQLVYAILRAPDQLPHHLDRTIQSIHRRCQDPIGALLALEALLPTLLSRVAHGLFIAEFHALIDQLPPAWRSQFELAIWDQALQLSPVRKLEFVRRFQRPGTHRGKSSSDAPFPGAPPAHPPGAPPAPPGRDGGTAPDGSDPDD